MDPVESRLHDAIVFLSWLSNENLPEHIRKSLQQADAQLRVKEYQAAHDLCRQAINQVSSESLNEIIYASAGHARVHLGAVYYARGDGCLDDAIECFTTASKELVSNHRAQAVAEFALGASYAQKGERTNAYRHISPEVLSTLKWYPAAKEVDKKWEEIQNRLIPNPAIPQSTLPAEEDNKPEPLPNDSEVPRPASDIPSEGDLPWLYRALIIATLAAIVVGCGLLVYLLTRNVIGLLAYLVVLPSATLLLMNRLKCKVQQDQALVIETGGAPKVRWGPRTYYRWPFNEQFCALVALSPLQYTSPPRRIKLKPDKSITIQLLVYYRVDADGRNDHHVIESMYRTQLAVRNAANPQQPKRSSNPCTPDVLKRVWEQRLLQDIIATLNRVLPGVSYEKLAGKPACDREEIIKRLHKSLSQRVSEWGMIIDEVGIVDVFENKS